MNDLYSRIFIKKVIKIIHKTYLRFSTPNEEKLKGKKKCEEENKKLLYKLRLSFEAFQNSRDHNNDNF